MFFNITLALSLAIFLIGAIYKTLMWRFGVITVDQHQLVHFKNNKKNEENNLYFFYRVFKTIKNFIIYIVFQRHLLSKQGGLYVWIMHVMIFYGFIMLLLMHALDNIFTENIFSNYLPTLNPYFFLRDFFGFMLLIGILMSVLRRYLFRSSLPPDKNTDYFGVVFLCLIILSGFLLGGLKISSPTVYQNMVNTYAPHIFEEKELQALEAFWDKHQGLASNIDFSSIDNEILSLGKRLHLENCSFCHADASWAMGSYAISKTIEPAVPTLERFSMVEFLYYFHFLICFIGLAYLPFSRMFHAIATPICIIVNSIKLSSPDDIIRQGIYKNLEMDCCQHGGSCHNSCPIYNDRQGVLRIRQNNETLSKYIQNRLKLNSK